MCVITIACDKIFWKCHYQSQKIPNWSFLIKKNNKKYIRNHMKKKLQKFNTVKNTSSLLIKEFSARFSHFRELLEILKFAIILNSYLKNYWQYGTVIECEFINFQKMILAFNTQVIIMNLFTSYSLKWAQ